MSNPDPADFEDAIAAMRDLQIRADRTAEFAPLGCASDLERATDAIDDALETYHEVHSDADE